MGRKNKQQEAGFGLVEVIISMVLLGIIAIALIPALWQGISISSKESAVATATRHLNLLVEEARDDPSCGVLGSITSARTLTLGDGKALTSSGTFSTCVPKTTVTVDLSVKDSTNAVLASTRSLVYVP